MKKILNVSKLFIFLLLIFTNTFTFAEKIKDITNIDGTRDNQLIGYGLVVGLNGTGDISEQVPFTTTTLKNILSKLGVTITQNKNMQLNNVASVMVTAELPLFSEIGEKVDVVVSSIGNCKSLEGGTLILTPLIGIDNKIYVVAQGKILTKNNSNMNNKSLNVYANKFYNTGKILNGGNIEKIVKNDFKNKKTINLQLKKENFILAKKISDEINKHYPNTAVPINSKKITILNNKKNASNIVDIISNIQNINIKVPTEPKIVINKNNGLIITNYKIVLEPCTINYKNLYINLQKNITKTNKQTTEKQIIIHSNLILNDMLQILKNLNLETNEIIEILKILKESKCLSAEIKISS
ncbi:flagellar basal body P-ring protein FlgI [Buchnera aphidicola (Chaitoregma tattakana)]|uniref:flagellar basal body P-ring protein FlgI n=1 Tax=Buchnera aphidicola TaxID=9 RepID=UPI0031B81EB8